MAFKKLDSDAVSSTTGRALDSFVLRGEAANYAQAYEDRGRSIGQAYTAERGAIASVDTRPVLASPLTWASCVPLGAFPVSARCRQLTAQVRGMATAPTGETDAVKIKIFLQRSDGSLIEEDATTTVAGSATAQTIDLTIATDSVQGETVVVWLWFVSIRSASIASGTHNGGDSSSGGAEIQLNHLSAWVYAATKRYSLTFFEDAAGASPRDDQGYPGEVMINRNRTGYYYRIIPALPPYIWQNEARQYDINAYELGRLEVYGWTVTETSFEALPDLADKLRPGGRLRARSCQELYRQGYHLASARTRLYSCGGTTAQLVLGSSSLVNMDPWSTRAIAGLIDGADDIYVSLIGDLPTYRVQETSAVPSTTYRRRYRVYALWAAAASGSNQDNVLQIVANVQLNSFGGGPSWGASTVSPSEGSGKTQTAPALIYERGEITSMSLIAAPAQELNYRWWAYSDVDAGRSGLRMMEFEFEEDAAQEAVLQRICRLRFDVTIAATGAPAPQVLLVFPGATLMIDEGF